ncbi:MAG TPA: monofunctional biosynthetic peptidoglycan transglycosylase [Allocoleopsis sp.]
MPRIKKRRQHQPFLVRLLWLIVQLTIALILLSILLVLPWRWLPPPTTSFMLQTAVRSGHLYHYRWTPYSDISPYMALAAIASEDQRFPDHHGFDLEAIEQAYTDYQQGGDLRGASTITQQVAKNLYLWSGRSLARKGLEAWFTLLIEVFWSKQRILEMYLNVAQFGTQEFGVEAASRAFFDKPASELTADESALLAAVLPAPELYQVTQPSEEVWQHQSWILQQMYQLGELDYLKKVQ